MLEDVSEPGHAPGNRASRVHVLVEACARRRRTTAAGSRPPSCRCAIRALGARDARAPRAFLAALGAPAERGRGGAAGRRRGEERSRNAPPRILAAMTLDFQARCSTPPNCAPASAARCCGPGEEGYDEARRVWNGAIDRRPALIARCAGADDVVEAVRFARERDLLVSVRGGGHAVAGHAVCDGGLMIDLSLMKAIRVDPAGAHRARGRRRPVGRARPRHPGGRAGHHRRDRSATPASPA